MDAKVKDQSGIDEAEIVDRAITSRRSVRRFLPDPVPRETVEQILAVASRAPSGTNMQPWRVYVAAGAVKDRLSERIVDAYLNENDQHQQEYKYYTNPIPEPYLSRRRKVGWDLYGLLGIAKGDKDKMRAQHARNYLFFDAPVGLVFTIDRILEKGSWLDYGMFLENVMVAARGRGLHTCPQAAFAQFHKIMRAELGVSEQEIVICGMSLGYADESAVEYQLETVREPVESFATFAGF